MAYITRDGVYLCNECVRDVLAAERERSPGMYYGVTVTPDDVDMERYEGTTEECSACGRERR
jgi:hypothetical protein